MKHQSLSLASAGPRGAAVGSIHVRSRPGRGSLGNRLPLAVLIAGLLGVTPLFGAGLAEEAGSGGPPAGAQAGPESQESSAPESGAELISFSETLSIQETDWGFRVNVLPGGPGTGESLTYLLARDPALVQPAEDNQIIRIPVTRLASLSTTFLPPIVELGELERLVAVDNLDFVFSPLVRAAGEAGDVTAVGGGSAVDTETLVALGVELVVANSFGGQFDPIGVLSGAGIPALVATDWLETSPLGRAEWVLLFGALFDRMAEAQEIVDGVAERYTELAERVAQHSEADSPGVLINAPFQGTWFMAGGNSYVARLISDAGGNYLFSDLGGTGGVPVDLESVLSRGAQADVWINPGIAASLAELVAVDPRFAELPPVTAGEVWNHILRVSPVGGNDYFESGSLFVDAVLADLIRIFRPGLLDEGEFTYYRRLGN